MRPFLYGPRSALVLLVLAAPAAARQACPPASPAWPAPVRNPVSLAAPNQEQWFTVPVAGGRLFELEFASSLGASATVTAFGRDCSRPLAAGFSAVAASLWFTVPEGERDVNVRIRTSAGLIEPVVATFRLADLGPSDDALPNDPSWARPLAADGVWIDGVIDYAADTDYYQLATTAGVDYRVEVEARTTPGCLGSFRIDHGGAAVWLFRATGGSELIRLPFCWQFTGYGDGPRPYRVRAIAAGDPLPPDRSGACDDAAGAPLGIGLRGEVTGARMGAPDEDAYAFAVAARRAYRLSFVGDVRADVFADDCGVPWVTSGDRIGPTHFNTDRAGVVRVVVRSHESPAPTPYEIRLDDLGPVGPDEPDQAADAMALAAGAAAVGGIVGTSTDSDVYRLAVEPGWVYELEVTGDVSAILLDPMIPSHREPLAGSTAVGPDGLVQRTVRLLMPSTEPSSRLLVVQAGAASAPASYTLALRRSNFIGPVDAPDDPEQAAATGIDGPIDFHLSGSQDADWLAYDGPGRRKYRVALVSAGVTGGGLAWWSGRWGETELQPGDATTLETDHGGRLVLGATLWGDRPTSLTASVTDLGPATDTEPDAPDDAFAIRPNRDTLLGVLDSGADHDVYRFRGRAGQAYRIVIRRGPEAGVVSAQVRPESDVRPLRVFGVVGPGAGEPVLWSVSPRFTQPAAPGATVLDVSAGGEPVTRSGYAVRIESVCRVDWNDDGAVGVSDLLDYLTDFLGDPANAEFDHEGEATVADVLAFIAAYFAGCPE